MRELLGDADKQFEKEWKKNSKMNKDIAKFYFTSGVLFMLRTAIKDLEKREKDSKRK